MIRVQVKFFCEFYYILPLSETDFWSPVKSMVDMGQIPGNYRTSQYEKAKLV